MYDAIASALEAAGWERFDRKLAGAAPSNANRDDVWYSTGENGKKQIHVRTASHSASGAATSQYLSIIIGSKRNDAATALSGTWTWNGTTTVTTGDTSQVRVGSYIRLDADGQWFKITAINPNVDVTIASGGFTIPTGATGSSQLTPDLEGDVGNAALGNVPPFNSETFRWDLGASDFSADFQIVADKDAFHCVLQNVTHTATMFVIEFGDLIPLDINPNVMFLSADVTAGDFKELLTVDENGAPANPILLGFRPMDRIQIVEVDPLSTPKAETQTIVEVLSDRIKVRRLRFAYEGRNFAVNPQRLGARIGMYPSPVFMRISADVEIEETFLTVNIRTPFFHDFILDGVDPQVPGRTQGDLVSVPTTKQGEAQYFIHYAQLTTHAQTGTEYGSGVTPNQRTLRFTMRSVAVGHFTGGATPALGSAVLGKIPRLATYNGTVTYYPHDNFLRDRPTPDQDFVPFRYTAASARNYALGPTPGP